MGGTRVMRRGGIILVGAVAFSLRNGLLAFTANLLGLSPPSPSRKLHASEGVRAPRVLSRAESAASAVDPALARVPLPKTTEAMCQQAADAVMRAYRDGWTRQTVRLRTDEVFDDQELYNKGIGGLLEASMPLAKSFTSKLWYGDSMKQIKTSALDTDAGTLLYREATNPLQDAAVLYLPGRDVVSNPTVRNFFTGMGDRLVVLSNTEQAPAQWKVENQGRDFYLVNDADVGAEVAETFRQQSYYLWQSPLNNWQVTYFRVYPHPWEIYIETLEYETIKIGEYETKPVYDDIIAAMEAYEEKNNIKAFKKVGKILKDNQKSPDADGEAKDGIEAFFDGLKNMF